jgi:hypothetical protein
MNFYQFKRVLFQIIQEIIKDPELEESYHISCCGFDKMNLISRTSLHGKNDMILKNDF